MTTNDGTVTHDTKHPMVPSQIIIPSVIQMDGPKATMIVPANGQQLHNSLNGQAAIIPNVVHQKRPSHLPGASQPQTINILVCPAPCSGRCAGNCPQECCQAQTQPQTNGQSVVVCQRPCINNCTKSCNPACCSLTEGQVASAEKSPLRAVSYLQPLTHQLQSGGLPCQGSTQCLNDGNTNNNPSTNQGVVVSQGQFVIHPNGQVTASKKEIGQKRGKGLKIQIISPYVNSLRRKASENLAVKKHLLSHMSRKKQKIAGRRVGKESAHSSHETLERKLLFMKTNIPLPNDKKHGYIGIASRSSKGIMSRNGKRYHIIKGRHAKGEPHKGMRKEKPHQLLKGKIAIKDKMNYRAVGRFRRSCECQTICKKSGIAIPKENKCITKCSGCPAGYEKHGDNELAQKKDTEGSKELNLVDTITDNVDDEEELVDYASEGNEGHEARAKKSETANKDSRNKGSSPLDKRDYKLKVEAVVTGTKKENILENKDTATSKEASLEEEEEIEDVPANEEEGEEIVKDDEETLELMSKEEKDNSSKKRKNEINPPSEDHQSLKSLVKHKTVATEDEFGNQEIVESDIVDPNIVNDDERISEGEKRMEEISAGAKELHSPHNHHSNRNEEDGEEVVEVFNGNTVANDEKGSEFASEINKKVKDRIKVEKEEEDKEYFNKSSNNDEHKSKDNKEGDKKIKEEDEVTINFDDNEKQKVLGDDEQAKKNNSKMSSEFDGKQNETEHNPISNKGSLESKLVKKEDEVSLDTNNNHNFINEDEVKFAPENKKPLKISDNKMNDESTNNQKKEGAKMLTSKNDADKPAILSINVEKLAPVNIDQIMQKPMVNDKRKEEDLSELNDDQKTKIKEEKQDKSSLLEKTLSYGSENLSDESGSGDSQPKVKQSTQLSNATKSTSAHDGSALKTEEKKLGGFAANDTRNYAAMEDDEQKKEQTGGETREKSSRDPYADIGSSDAGVDYAKDRGRHTEGFKENKTMTSDNTNAKKEDHSIATETKDKPTSILENFKKGGDPFDTGFFMDSQTLANIVDKDETVDRGKTEERIFKDDNDKASNTVKEATSLSESNVSALNGSNNVEKYESKMNYGNDSTTLNEGSGDRSLTKEGLQMDQKENKKNDQENQEDLRKLDSNESWNNKKKYSDSDDPANFKKPDQEIKNEDDLKKNAQDNLLSSNDIRPTQPIMLDSFHSNSKSPSTQVSQKESKEDKTASSISLSQFQTNDKRPDEVSFQETYGGSENKNEGETDLIEENLAKEKKKQPDDNSENSSTQTSTSTSDGRAETAAQNKTTYKGLSNNLSTSVDQKTVASKQAAVNDSKVNENATSPKMQGASEKEKHEENLGSASKSNSKNNYKSEEGKEQSLSNGSGRGIDKSEDAYKEIASGEFKEEENDRHFTPVNIFSDVDKNGDLVEVEKDDPDGSIVTMTVDKEGNEEVGGDEDGMDVGEQADAKNNLINESVSKELGDSEVGLNKPVSSTLSYDIDDNQDIDAEKEALETFNNEHNENEEMSLDSLAKILDDLDKSVDSIRVKNATSRHKFFTSTGKTNKQQELKKEVDTGEKQGGNKKGVENIANKEQSNGNKIHGEQIRDGRKNEQLSEKERTSNKHEKNNIFKDRKQQLASKMSANKSLMTGTARKAPVKKLGVEESNVHDDVPEEIDEGIGDSSDLVSDADGGGNEDEAVEVVEPNDILLFTKNADSQTGDWFEKVVKPHASHKVSKNKKLHRKNGELEGWDESVDDTDLLQGYDDESDGSVNTKDDDNVGEISDEDSRNEKNNFAKQVSNVDNTMSMDQLKEINKAIMKDDDVQFKQGSKHIDASMFDLPDEQDDIANQVKESSKSTMEKIADAVNAENRLEDRNSFPDDLVNTKFFNHEISDNEIDQYSKGVDDMSSDSIGAPLKSLDPLYGDSFLSKGEQKAKPVEEKTADVKHNILPNSQLTKVNAEGENVNGPNSSFDGGDEFLNPESHTESAKARQDITPKKGTKNLALKKDKNVKSAKAFKSMLGLLRKGAKTNKMQQKSIKAKRMQKKSPVMVKALKNSPDQKKAVDKTRHAPTKAQVKKPATHQSLIAKKGPTSRKNPSKKQLESSSKPSAGLKENGSKLARLVKQVVKQKFSQPLLKVSKMEKLNDSLTLIDEMESQIDKELQKGDSPVINEAEAEQTIAERSGKATSNGKVFDSSDEETSLGFDASPTEQITLKSLLPEYGTESPGMKVSYVNERSTNDKITQFPNPQEEEFKQAPQVLRDMNSKDHHARLKQAKALLQMQKYEADNALSSVKDIQSKAMDEILKTSMERQKAFVDKIANKYEKDYYSPTPSPGDPPVNEEGKNLREDGSDSDIGEEDHLLAAGSLVKLYPDSSFSAADNMEGDNDESLHPVIVQKDGISESNEDSPTNSEDDPEERTLQDKDVEDEDDRRISEMTDENEDDDVDSEEAAKSDSIPDNDVDDNDDDDDDGDD